MVATDEEDAKEVRWVEGAMKRDKDLVMVRSGTEKQERRWRAVPEAKVSKRVKEAERPERVLEWQIAPLLLCCFAPLTFFLWQKKSISGG